NEFAISVLGGSKSSRDEWDKELQGTSVYKAIKEKYPNSYDEILDTYYVASTKGTPRGQLLADGRAKVDGFVRKLLPHADDAVLVQFGRLLVDKYTAIQALDPTTCFQF